MNPILHERCGMCSRKLKTQKSKEDGCGPVCAKKAASERKAREQDADG
ncbi:MAG: hypothetical protein K0Q77_26 [Anaerosporomusa subterranea]|jgi:hypothetical protein|nr:hypothetical protein [Anaerosporomusa subterranea]